MSHGAEEVDQVRVCRTQGTEGDEALAGLGGLQPDAHALGASLTELGQEPDGAGGDVRIGLGQKRGYRFDGAFSLLLQFHKGGVADVGGGGFEAGDLVFDGVELQGWSLWLEALRRDAVDGATACFIGVLMAAGAFVEPVADVDGTIGADADIAGAEEGVTLIGHVVLAADEVAAFEDAGGVCS